MVEKVWVLMVKIERKKKKRKQFFLLSCYDMFFFILNVQRLYGEDLGLNLFFDGRRSVFSDFFLVIKILLLDIVFNNGYYLGNGDINGIIIVIIVFIDMRKCKRGLINVNGGKMQVLMWLLLYIERFWLKILIFDDFGVGQGVKCFNGFLFQLC